MTCLYDLKWLDVQGRRRRQRDTASAQILELATDY